MERMELILWEASEAATDEAIAALRKSKLFQEAHVVDHVAGTLCSVRSKAPIATWVARAREVLTDLELAPEPAEAVVDAFRDGGVLDWQLAVGTECIAVLDEDAEWHEAVVDGDLSYSTGLQRVVFHEWQKPQSVPRDAIVVVADDDDEQRNVEEGQCELCQRRRLPLTFHHLVPKEEHHNYVGHPPPEPWAALLRARSAAKQHLPALTRLDLNTHGIMVCRPCHSAVHRAETNAALARSWCTADALAQHPSVAKFVAYARKQKVRTLSQ